MHAGCALETEPTLVKESRSFHISIATLDLDTLDENDFLGCVQLWLRKKRQDRLLVTLNRNIPQVPLDLAFAANEKIKFYTKGMGQAYLSGYYIPQEDEEAHEIHEIREIPVHYDDKTSIKVCFYIHI